MEKLLESYIDLRVKIDTLLNNAELLKGKIVEKVIKALKTASEKGEPWNGIPDMKYKCTGEYEYVVSKRLGAMSKRQIFEEVIKNYELQKFVKKWS